MTARERIGRIIYGERFAPGHDYDSGEEVLEKLAALLPLPEDFILRQDGDAWMCVRGDFINLQESPSVWGKTPAEALARLTSKGENET